MNNTYRTAAGNAAALSVSFAGGCILTGSTVAGVASFADISLCGALPLPCAAAALAGSLVRGVMRRSVGRLIVKLTAMILVLISKMFFSDSREPRSCGASTAAAVMIAGSAVSAVIGELPQKLLFYIFYACASGVVSCCTAYIYNGIRRGRTVDLRGTSGLAYAFVYVVFISSLCSAGLPAVNVGIVLGSALTLAAAYFYGSTGGLTVGALTVCGVFLSSSLCGMSVVMLPLAGLTAGRFTEHRSIMSASVFTAVSFLFSSVMQTGTAHTDPMLNTLCGAGAFLVLAPFFTDKWIVTGSVSENELTELRRAQSAFLASSVGSVRNESSLIADRLAQPVRRSTEIAETRRAVCDNCYRRAACWSASREETMRGFRQLSRMTEFSKETFPAELSDCLRRDELSREISARRRVRADKRLLDMRLAGTRRLLNEQICVTEDITAAPVGTGIRRSAPVTRTAMLKLARAGLLPRSLTAYYNSRSRLIIEMYYPAAGAPAGTERIRDLLSDELHTELELSEPFSSGNEVRLRLSEPPEYALEVCGAAVCADGSRENGDSTAVFSDGMGTQHVVLSDGMGSGKRAALQSRMAVRLYRRLVGSGMPSIPAIRMINSIMLTKSGDETFATLDAASFDLDECSMNLIKSGASATLLCRRGSVMRITAPTFPIGIYETAETFSADYRLEAGDTVVMFSDGISENEYLFIKELLLSGAELEHVVSEICAKAEVFSPDMRSDDITVIGIRVKHRSKCAL